MRFIPIMIMLVVISTFPSFILHLRFRNRYANAVFPVLIWALPVLFLLIFAAMILGGRYDIFHVSHRFVEWYLWAFALLFWPLFTYAFFYLLDKLFRRLFHHRITLFRKIGAVVASLILVGLVIGALTRHCIQVRKVELSSPSLPASFDGTRIVHITDLHLGNLTPERRYLKRVIDVINAQHPDLLFFTGDLVNLSADDGNRAIGLFSSVDAPLGRFAVMGNHDYGDYMEWDSDAAYLQNIDDTYDLYRDMGFSLLNDTATYVRISSDSIGIVGVQYIGRPPFHTYGDMKKATASFAPAPFNILLSHDPDHWKYEVRSDYRYIDLTLSGHTHSAQCGIDLCGIKFSPSQFLFEYWDGLYSDTVDGHTLWLYVSRGLGYVGIPFRLGMPPEVTLITLRCE